jgi:hypothetical protein
MRWPCGTCGRDDKCISVLKERHHLEDLGVDGVIILKWTLKNQNGKVRTGFIGLDY